MIWQLLLILSTNIRADDTSNVTKRASHSQAIQNWKDGLFRILGPGSTSHRSRYYSPGILNHFNELDNLIPDVMSAVGDMNHIVRTSSEMIRISSRLNDTVFATIFLSDGTLEISAAFRSSDVNFYMSDVIRHQWRLAFLNPTRSLWANREWVPSNIRRSEISNSQTLIIIRETEQQVNTASQNVQSAERENSEASRSLASSDGYFTSPSERSRLFNLAQGTLMRLETARRDLNSAKSNQLKRILEETDNGRSTWRIARDFGLQISRIVINGNTIDFNTEQLNTLAITDLPFRNNIPSLPQEHEHLRQLRTLDDRIIYNNYKSDLRRFIRAAGESPEIFKATVDWFNLNINLLEERLFRIIYSEYISVRQFNQLIDINLLASSLLKVFNSVNLTFINFYNSVYLQEANGTKSLSRRLRSIIQYLSERGY